MDLWAYEKVRLAPQRARLVYGKVHSVYEMGLRAYGKGLRGPHGRVLRRAVVSAPDQLLPPSAPLRS